MREHQVNVLTPLDGTVGPVQVVVTSSGTSSSPFTVNLQAAAPSFPLIGATNYILATHADNSLVGPATAKRRPKSLAQGDLTVAFNDAAGRTTPVIVAGDLGGQTLTPGLYKSTSTLGITGVLTLDGQGNVNSVFIFQIASGLTTASGSQVVLQGGAQAANIFWQVGSSATLGTNSIFNGTILAQASVTLATGATLNGRALARTGAVTLDSSTAVNPGPSTSGAFNGFVQVCKVAGAGVAMGTNFSFNVAGTPVTVPAGPAPGGSCGTPVLVSPGTAVIMETIPASTLVAGVSTLPSAGLLVSSNLATVTATVTVLAGGQTIVTFIDVATPAVPTNGFVQVCKVAGAGVVVGTNFSFTVAGTPVTVPAGPAPGGSCGTPVTVPAGLAVITETVQASTVLSGVGTLPSAALLVSSNLVTGTATVTVLAGGQTIVTFIDGAAPIVPIPVMSPAALAGFALLLAGLGWVFSRKGKRFD
jgi:hypothetical protein